MSTKYFRLLDDVQVPGRWYLNGLRSHGGESVDNRKFTQGTPVREEADLRVGLRRSGRPLDFTLADFDLPVISGRIRGRLQEVAGEDVQVIPVEVEGQDESFYILNVTRTERCLDEALSDVLVWGPQDGRPEKAGEYRMVTEMKVDPRRTAGADVFRIKGWEVALIVSEDAKGALEGLEGIRLQEV